MKYLSLFSSIIIALSSSTFAAEWPTIDEAFIRQHQPQFEASLTQEEHFSHDWRGPRNFHHPINLPLNNDHWGIIVSSGPNPRIIKSFDEVLTHLKAGNISLSRTSYTTKPMPWNEKTLHTHYQICPTESGIPGLREAYRRLEMWNENFGNTILMEIYLVHPN